eukprot:TRINITY_DN756_c0_g1_i2.p1 TRINITY_DN756_c0_g1~~TRINITY_DN756_c0_g1_i2.p1  ORF type:complete len:332 (-),score=72.78 TRINITY_DN756_c0_g1_i2:9-1004(-)
MGLNDRLKEYGITTGAIVRFVLFCTFLTVCIVGVAICTAEGWTVKFLDWVQSLGWWGYIIFYFTFALMAFPFAYGYTIFGLGAGFLYGIWVGTLIMVLGTNSGSVVSFLGCRLLFRSYIENTVRANPKLLAIFNAIGEHGFKIAFMLRFIPIPFGVQNAIMSISSVTLIRYVIATALGLLPEQIIIVYLGTSLNSLSGAVSGDSMGAGKIIILVVQIVAACLLLVIFIYIGKKALKNITKEEEAKLAAQAALGTETEGLLASNRSLGKSGGAVDIEDGRGHQIAIGKEVDDPEMIRIVTPSTLPSINTDTYNDNNYNNNNNGNKNKLELYL